MPACGFDDTGGDGPTGRQSGVVAQVFEVVAQVAGGGVGSLAPVADLLHVFRTRIQVGFETVWKEEAWRRR
jgi:hypothetical protein